MSRSPHRFRGDPAECWRAILFGELVRTLNRPLTVLAQETIRLPRSGRWESGLGKVTPALDDALGATAFAVAWRWACAEKEANAWPGLPLIARKATDAALVEGPGPLLASAEGVQLGLTGARTWTLGDAMTIGVTAPDMDWSEVDRIADITAAWLGLPWK